jgi:hypothetical protein
MHLSAKILGIGGAAVLAFAAMSPASAMPTAPRSAVVDSADAGVIQIRNGGGNRGWKGGGNWRGGYRAGYRAGYRPGYRYWNRPGYGWGWWGPGIVAGAAVGAAIAAPYYYGAPGPGLCRVWGPGYWTYAPCPY